MLACSCRATKHTQFRRHTCASRKTIEWAGPKGQALVATVKVTRGLEPRVINADGDIITTDKVVALDTTLILVHMDGVQVARGDRIVAPLPGQDCAGVIGGRLGLRAAQVESINAAIE